MVSNEDSSEEDDGSSLPSESESLNWMSSDLGPTAFPRIFVNHTYGGQTSIKHSGANIFLIIITYLLACMIGLCTF